MSADPLDRAFGISGDRVTQTSWEQDAIVLCLEQPRQTLRCSACGSRDVHRKGSVSREFKTLPIGSQTVRLQLVFDRFHLVKLLNEHLTELRRELQREAEEGLQKQVLKGTRWLLLKHPAHLDNTRNERQRLDEALRLNASLATAYYLKEDLRQIWEQPTKHLGELVLERWIRMAEATGIRQLLKFARTLRKHRQGILAWYDHPISTGPLEGTNNKIKPLQRQAFGYRDREFFKLRLLGLHQCKHAFVG